MTHLILCREYAPAPYPAGGIGTYAGHIARLLAEAGETVHVIAQRWEGAPAAVSESCGGRLIVHRISLDEPVALRNKCAVDSRQLLRSLGESNCPSQLFSWQAARAAEFLIEQECIDTIEAQEWEAPLYYLQVRRALGLGPSRRPPCLVHLHSPSELIFRHNKWDLGLTDYAPLTRFEKYTALAADALVCPSRYLAQDAAELFQIDRSRIEVIPYPLGNTPEISRTPEVWARDAVCYFGRLELRKGVVEWVDAAVQIAAEHQGATFEFIGSDTSLDGSPGGSVLEYLKGRIPRVYRRRFRFHGSQSHSELLHSLAAFPIAVIPSTWENFPYSCIESMATGMPVLASPKGGMSELIADGRSGWIAKDATPPELAAALRKALATSPAERERLGKEAARAVRRICSNRTIVERHLELRERLVFSGVSRSVRIPGGPIDLVPTNEPTWCGLGVVVTCPDGMARLKDCLDEIGRQTDPAKIAIIVVDERFGPFMETPALRVVTFPTTSPENARRLGAGVLLGEHPELSAIAFISSNARIPPDFFGKCQSLLVSQSNVGSVLPWIFREARDQEIEADASVVSQSDWSDEATLPSVIVRAQALSGGAWPQVTYAGLLVSAPALPRLRKGVKRYSVMALAQGSSVKNLVSLLLRARTREKIQWISRIVKRPEAIAKRLLWQYRIFRTGTKSSKY